MSQQIINIGAAEEDGTGDHLRVAFDKSNQNFTELYAGGAYAPLASPTFTGDPKAPTPTAGDNDTSIATTAFVSNAITALVGTAGPGADTLGELEDQILLTNTAVAARAPLASPTFTGDPKAPTPATADNDTSVATTAFVKAQGYLVSTDLASYAPLASPALTGNPTAPTPTAGDNDTSVATTAFVTTAIAGKADTSALAAKADLASPTFTGDPKAPTPTAGDNDTSIATTAFTQAAITALNLATTYAPLASPTLTGDPKAPTPATADNDTSIATTAYVQAQGYLTSAAATAAYQPLDGDLTAIAALTGTNTIYYRSAANTWSPVNVSTGLSFSGGNLTATGGAPVGAEYITSTADATLTSERVLTDTATVTWDRTTAGQIKANAASTTISDTPPGSPNNGSMWWESDTGILWISYNDGNTTQWVAVGGGVGVLGFGSPQGRLTLAVDAAPVLTTTVSGATTINYSAYVGDRVPIFNGATWAMTQLDPAGHYISGSTTDTTRNPSAIGASKVNDWFVWDGGAGVLYLSHGPDWTSDTARSAGTALVRVNGIWLNNASITNGPAAQRGTYVGTTRSNASSTLDWVLPVSPWGTQARLCVWNCYNRRLCAAEIREPSSSWAISSQLWQFWNGDPDNSCLFVRGLDEDAVEADCTIFAAPSAAAAYAMQWAYNGAIGGSPIFVEIASSYQQQISLSYTGMPGIGAYTLHTMESQLVSGGASCTVYGGPTEANQQFNVWA